MRLGTVTGRAGRIFTGTALLLVLLGPDVPASAHVEKGSMPDSVAEMEYRILLEFTPQDTRARALLGMALWRQGKLAEAEREFRLILQSDQNNFDALDSLGLVLTTQKRYREAVQPLQAAIKIRPGDLMVHLHLGVALGNNAQPDLAREILSSGLLLLQQQPPAKLKEQQLAEFKSALAALPNKPVPRR